MDASEHYLVITINEGPPGLALFRIMVLADRYAPCRTVSTRHKPAGDALAFSQDFGRLVNGLQRALSGRPGGDDAN